MGVDQGANTLNYATAAGAVTASLLTGTTGAGLDGDGGTDTFSNILNIIGSSFADMLTGDGNANTITGGVGADTMDGGGGNDTFYLANGDFSAGESITGAGGTDAVILTNATTVDFTSGALATVETLTGSSGNDTVTLLASHLAGMFTGVDLAGGTDVLNTVGTSNISAATLITPSNVETGNIIGTGGNDSFTATGTQIDALLIGGGTINMGAGTDTLNITSTSADFNTLGGTDASIQGLEAVSAASAGAGVVISITAQTESFTVTGSAQADTISGGKGSDVIDGGAGNDTIYSGSNDYLTAAISSLATVYSGGALVSGTTYYYAATGNFYQYVNTNSTWTAANAAASGATLNGVGGHQVQITSSTENSFIDTGIGTDETWLGGSDSATSNAWLFVGGVLNGLQFWSGTSGGSAVNGFYNNWGGSQPNNSPAGSDYQFQDNGGTWDDLKSTGRSKNSYVIEWDGSQILASFITNRTTIDGGAGADDLYGSSGADTFLFKAATFNSGGTDTIHNYDITDLDKIDIRDLLIGYTAGSSDNDLFARFVSSGSDTILQVDRDGSGGSYSFTNVATISGVATSSLPVMEEMVANGLVVMA